MKIINLKAENIKKLTAIDITPTEDMITITGANGAGKSSVLDCIVMGLCGGKAIPAIPIKKGADKGKIVIELEGYQITRSFTKESSYLKIEGVDGAKVSSPQAFLDKIVGNISFDPLDFLNNEKKKQRDILLQLLGVNVDEIDKKEKELRDQRTIIGRDVGKAKAIYASENHYPEIKATKEISVSELSAKLRDAMTKNSELEAAKQANENLKALAKKDIDRIAIIDDQILTLTNEKNNLEESIRNRKTEYIAVKARLAEAIPVSTEEIEEEISTVEETNQKIRANVKKAAAQKELQTAEDGYADLTKQIESIATERASLLSNASMPVDGLSFDDGGLLYNSIPLDQASDGEKLMVSLGISMALNPTLRVLRIKDGSLLDEKNRAIIRTMIADKDYQLWFESVGSDGKVGILIEEGEIVSVDGEKVKAKEKKAATKAPSKSHPPDHDPLLSQIKDNTSPDDTGW